jgi:hypothetical protein
MLKRFPKRALERSGTAIVLVHSGVVPLGLGAASCQKVSVLPV